MNDESAAARAELHAAFAHEARRRLDTLERGLARGDVDSEELGLHAHTLRGSAAVVGLAEAEELGVELERAVREDPDRARELVTRLRAIVETLPTAPGGDAPPAGGERIVLYIEDDRPNAVLVQRMLGNRPGVRMLDAPTGAEGLRLARAHPPALVLLDLRLPDMHGLDVLAALRSDPATASIPVGVVTGGAPKVVLERLEATGVDAILTKPFDAERLLAVVDAALAA